MVAETMSDFSASAVFPLLVANLVQSVRAYEQQKADENTDNHLHPRQASAARAIRVAIVDWLAENGPSTAAEVAEQFQYHKTTAHSYLNRIVHDGQARMINRRNRRIFAVEES
jgi:predicted HTH transcriptional regulator